MGTLLSVVSSLLYGVSLESVETFVLLYVSGKCTVCRIRLLKNLSREGCFVSIGRTHARSFWGSSRTPELKLCRQSSTATATLTTKKDRVDFKCHIDDLVHLPLIRLFYGRYLNR